MVGLRRLNILFMVWATNHVYLATASNDPFKDAGILYNCWEGDETTNAFSKAQIDFEKALYEVCNRISSSVFTQPHEESYCVYYNYEIGTMTWSDTVMFDVAWARSGFPISIARDDCMNELRWIKEPFQNGQTTTQGPLGCTKGGTIDKSSEYGWKVGLDLTRSNKRDGGIEKCPKRATDQNHVLDIASIERPSEEWFPPS